MVGAELHFEAICSLSVGDGHYPGIVDQDVQLLEFIQERIREASD